MPARTYTRLDCPQCQSPLKRVRRVAGERSAQDHGGLRRYRCIASSGETNEGARSGPGGGASAAGCGWEGLLPRRVRRPRRVLLRQISAALRRAVLPASALAGFGLTLAAVAWQADLLKPGAQRGYALGEQHDGETLPAAHPLARFHARAALRTVALAASAPAAEKPVAASQGGTLQLRYGCVWGKPGSHPYRGSVEQALRSAAMPEEVVQSVAAQVRAGQPVDKLEIRNDGVHALASGRVFSAQNIAMTYGQTLCLGTRVNFHGGHMEPAKLYEASTRDGRVVAVMVPEVCGNVSVLGQSDDAVRTMRLSGGGGSTSDARWLPAVLDGATGATVAAAVLEIPEPGTLACVVAALAAWLLAFRLLRR